MSQPQTEQRTRNPRARISELIYMNLQAGNGGILVDVSRTGLGFQAAEPIDTTAPVNFKIAAGAIGAIELTGELIWTDRARKRGGLRFGHVPIEVRQQIQNWLERPNGSAIGDNAGRNQFWHEDFSRAGAAIPKVPMPRLANDAHEAMHLHNGGSSDAHTSEAQTNDGDVDGMQARVARAAGLAQAGVAQAGVVQVNDPQVDDWNVSDTKAENAPLSDTLASDLPPSHLTSDEAESLVADRSDTNSAPATIDSSHVDEVDAAGAVPHGLPHGSTKFSDAKLGDPKIVDANFSAPRHIGPGPVGTTAGTKIGSPSSGTNTGVETYGAANYSKKRTDAKPGDAEPSATATSGAKPNATSAANANDDVRPRTSQQSAQQFPNQSYVGPLGIPLRMPASSTSLSEQAAGYRATLNPRSIFVSDQEFKARLRAFESSQRRRRGRITAIAGIIAVVLILAGGAYLYNRQTGSSIVQLAERFAGRGNAEANNSKYAGDDGSLSSFSSKDSDQSLAPSLAMSPSLAAPQPEAPNPATQHSGNNSAGNNSPLNDSKDASAGNAAAGNSTIGGASNSAVNQDSTAPASARNPGASADSSANTSTSTFAGTATNQPPASGTHPVVPSVAPSVVPSVAPSHGAANGARAAGNESAAAANTRANPGPNTGYAASRSASESPTGTGAANSRSLDGGSADLALANRYLQSGSSNERAVGAQLLWTAVGEGNTQAELELADLYLRGDAGLSKNCTQARVLLMAASESYSPVAQEKLEDLPAYGCK
jgi:PilZ domain